ncbi:MAG: nucleotidyl transferase AbiEii/AbiGii toxin family protein [Chloroflexi bacterium]|nr:nucleotidyl transferase AbiEii/AbiGii toxin family protein [Chloroflexota bacterium]
MEALAQPHWEALPPKVAEVLQNLARATSLEPFYLAGGTALALRLGHRISVDLDFFGPVETFDDVWRHRMIQDFGAHFSIEVPQNSPLGLVLGIEGVDVGFYTYGYEMLDPLNRLVDVPIAGIADIGLMKLDAIADRGRRKDFVDLYFIAQRVTLEQLLSLSKEKYPYDRYFVIRSLEALVEFDVADAESDLRMLVPTDWEEVKRFFVEETVRLGKKWIKPK